MVGKDVNRCARYDRAHFFFVSITFLYDEHILTFMKRFIPIMAVLLLICAPVAASDEMRTITAISENPPTWDYGITSVSTMSDTEKTAISGAIASVPSSDDKIIYAPPTMEFPAKFDWRKQGGVTPVKYQGSCGSCWAFGAIGVIESKILIDEGKTIDLSEQHMISCTDAGTCGGGWPDEVLKYAKKTGIPTERCYPYTGRNDRECNACDNWESIAWKIEDCVYVSPTTDSFKYAVEEYGPIVVVISVPEDWYYYRSGVYEPAYEGNLGWANHAVSIVGWNDTDGCWYVKNSWGQNWGEDGYARVKYGIIEQYNYAYAVTGIVAHGDEPNGNWINPVSVNCSSEYSENYPATNAIDNNTATHWFATINDPSPTLTFDLGAVRRSSAIRVALFRLDVPMTFDVQVSDDGGAWETVLENAAVTESGVLVEVPCRASGRYFRVCDMHGARMYTSLSEFAVECAQSTGLTLTLKYEDKTEVFAIDDLVSLTVSDGGINRLLWRN